MYRTTIEVMDHAIDALAWAGTAALAILAVAAAARRRLHPHPVDTALTRVVVTLAALSLSLRVADIVGTSRALSDLSVALFALSGWWLLDLRDVQLGVSRRWKAVAAAWLTGAAAAVIAVRIPLRESIRLSTADLVALVGLVGAWSLIALGTALSFWRAGGPRPVVQRARLRSMSVAMLGFVVILVIAVGTAPSDEGSPLALALQALTLAMMPLLFGAVAPPSFLRRVWRAREQSHSRSAIETLLGATDTATLAREALGWALRLLGAGSGLVIGPGGDVIAAVGMDPGSARDVAGALRRPEHPAVVPLDGVEGAAITAPIGIRGAGGMMVALPGRFTPTFGAPELGTLTDFAAAVSAAFERVELTDRLREEVQRSERALVLERRRAGQLEIIATQTHHLAGTLKVDELADRLASVAAQLAGTPAAAVGLLAQGSPLRWYTADGQEPDPHLAACGAAIAGSGKAGWMTVRAGDMAGEGSDHAVLGAPMVKGGMSVGVIVASQPAPEGSFDEHDVAAIASLAAYGAEAVEGARAFERERALVLRMRESDEIKSAFLASISHELRTPLTAVLGFAKTLERNGPSLEADQHAEVVRRLAVNAVRLERQLADLLDLDRLRRGVSDPIMRPEHLDRLILSVVEHFDLPDGRPVRVSVKPLRMNLDAPKVERIMENLLANAVRHTREGTPIWVRTITDDRSVTIVVEDAGPGVPEDARSLVFDQFRSGPGASRHSPGLGIGLTLVARFAQLHGGHAWVEERPGGGSSFRVRLPFRVAPSGPGIPTPAGAFG